LARAKHWVNEKVRNEPMANEGDLQVHRATYTKVIGVLKYGAVACFIIAFAVVWLISGK
jgi:hypothetical protein